MKLDGNQIYVANTRIGYLSRDKDGMWLVCPRKRADHYFRILDGWGIAEEVIRFLEDKKALGIKLVLDEKEVLQAPLTLIRLHGREVCCGGFEPQLVMSEYCWLKGGQKTLV